MLRWAAPNRGWPAPSRVGMQPRGNGTRRLANRQPAPGVGERRASPFFGRQEASASAGLNQKSWPAEALDGLVPRQRIRAPPVPPHERGAVVDYVHEPALAVAQLDLGIAAVLL